MTIFKKNTDVYAAKHKIMYPFAAGEIISLESIDDPVISSLIVGNGFALVPSENNVCSPVSGVVKSIANNNRAITVKTDDGLIAVIHIGTKFSNVADLSSTVLKVAVNDRIEAGQIICVTDIEKAAADGRDLTLLMIISNYDCLKSFSVNYGRVDSVNVPAAVYDL